MGILQRKKVDAPASPVLALSEEVVRVLTALPFEWIIVDSNFRVLQSSPNSRSFGFTSDRTLDDRVVRAQVVAAFRAPLVDEVDVVTGAPSVSRVVRVRTARLDAMRVCVFFEDVSQSLRVDAMRRDFVVNVSHELKTPVGALLLLAEAAQSAIEDPVTLTKFVERMQLEAQRLSALVNDLSDLSRLQSEGAVVQQAEIPVERLVAEAVDATQLLAQSRRIDVQTFCAPGLVVLGDETQLLTALRNLLANAITYSPPFTLVSVKANVCDRMIDIAVCDQGIGIPKAEQERIFERFYRVDPARSRETGGTGLGLSIVKHICSAHGGDCTVWSVPDGGSTFTLRLPGFGPDAASAPRSEQP